jgi:hypothetical protein
MFDIFSIPLLILLEILSSNLSIGKSTMNKGERLKQIIIDEEKGKRLAEILYNTFHDRGIHGQTEMPEDIEPAEVARGSLEHLMFITLTVSIDYMRDANALWRNSRKTFEDLGTRYLFDAKSIKEANIREIKRDMAKYSLAQRINQDANIWKTVETTFYTKWDGDPRNFLNSCEWNAPNILQKMNKAKKDFPYLSGSKIGPLWLRMLRDNVGIKILLDIDKIPIPVDVHVARATLATGIVHGSYEGSFGELFSYVRRAWWDSVEGIYVSGRPMIAIDVDEPLWHLSKYGCTYRDKQTGSCKMKDACPAKDFCLPGKIIIDGNHVEVKT